MSDNHYNKYSNEFQPPSHYQVKANVSSNNGTNQQFSYGVNSGPQQAGFESNTHLSSLSNCVKRLQTQLNQYLTKIIDEGSDGPTNYNLGSGEVLNSHLMEQYSSSGAPNPVGNPYGHVGDSTMNNGYSYYSNYPANYPAYPTPPQAPYHHPHHPAATSATDYYNHQQHQYSNFQEPKSKMNQEKPAHVDHQARIDLIRSTIKSYPDYPKPGINFRDIFPVFQKPDVLEDTIAILVDHIRDKNPDVQAIIGLEARGFLLGPLLALRLKVPFVPIRKAGKLPGKVESIEYDLEYGSDKMEIQKDCLKPGTKCIIVDDVLATGGTAKGAINLIKKCESCVLELVVVIEILSLKGRDKLPEPTYSLVGF